MLCLPILKRALVAVGLSVALAAGTALAKPAEAAFYEAYYLEHERGEMETAAGLYAEALEAGGLNPVLEAQGQARLAACREEIACADFARLMPPETLVYLEINNPGDQLGNLLGKLGLMAGSDDEVKDWKAAAAIGKHVAVSPILIEELMGIRGVAVALTGFDPMSQTPAGVAVFHPGSVDAIRGMLESALPAAAEVVKPIHGYPTYRVEEKVYICLTSRLVVVSPQRPQIVAVLKRIAGKLDKSLATNELIAEALQSREDSAMFFCVNAKPIMPMITAFAGASRELAMANAIVDFNSLKWIAGRAGVGEHGMFFDLGIRLDQGQHNLAYNVMRTPPITRETLGCIPQGVAGFIAAALGDVPRGGHQIPAGAGDATPVIIGLDFGREIFANIVDFVIYALPPAGHAGSLTGPAPDVAMVIRVNDPAKSQALWTQMLGIGSMAAGAPTTDGKVESVSGADVRTYKFPAGVAIYFATVKDKIVVAATRHAMERTLETAGGGASILADATFAPSLARINEHTSKAVFVHPGRCFEIAKRYMGTGEIKEAEPIVAMLSDMVTSLLTDESEELFHLSASMTGLPDVGDFVAQMMQREENTKRTRRELRSALRSGKQNEALTLGKRFIEQGGDDARALNRLAWALLTEEEYAGQHNKLALEMAEKACALTNYRNWAILDTLALAKFETGDVDQAIELQTKVITLGGGDDKDVEERLARYQAAKNETAEAQSE